MKALIAVSAVLLCLCLSKSNVDAYARAFCAYVTNDKIYSAGEKIEFNGLSYIAGGGYSTAQSQYTIQQKGIYFFTFNIYSGFIASGGPARSSAQLVIQNEPMIDALSYNDNSPYIIVQTSQSFIQKCTKNQVVYIRSRYDDNSIGAFENRTQFCGFCINC